MSKTVYNESLSGSIAQQLKHISRLIDGIIEEYYKPYNVTVAQADVMNRIHNEGKLSMNALCRDLDMSKSNLSPICKKLEMAGLLKKTRDFYDQRVVYLELTEDGKCIIEKTNAALGDAGLSFTTLLDQGKIESLQMSMLALETALENVSAKQ